MPRFKVYLREVHDTEAYVDAPTAYQAGDKALDSMYSGHHDSKDVTWVVAPSEYAIYEGDVMEVLTESGEVATGGR